MTTKKPTNIRGLIIDMDGVLWWGEQSIVDLPRVFAEIDRRGFRYILATNNATRSVEQYIEKLKNFGVEVPAQRVINSAQATAHYLHRRHPQGGSVYMIGESGLAQALEESGFMHSTDEPVAVVVGLDRDFSYKKLRLAAAFIRDGKSFIATNPDPTLPSPDGPLPGTGAILAALEAATGVAATIVGKPEPEMYRVALERMSLSPPETLVVGDRLKTDIAGGQALGCPTALVLSGASSEAEGRNWSPAPDFIEDNLVSLIDRLP
jgi:4-nitrophenyl phosphatase